MIRILVEGTKDVAFFKALFAARFPSFVESWQPVGSKDGAAFTFGNTMIELWPIGGYTKLAKNKNAAEDKLGVGLRVAIVFDADTTGVEKGGVKDRTALIQKCVSEWSLQAPPSMPLPLFLFPDNVRDGELETLMEDIVAEPYRPYISECWRGYETCLALHGGKAPSQKSKMNDYEAAVIGKKVWDHGGIEDGLSNPDLWNWHSPALQPLVTFIERLIAKV